MPSHPKTKQRESSRHGSSPKRPQQDPSRLRLAVGDEWPDGPAILNEGRLAREDVLRSAVIAAIVVLSVVLIVMLTLHAMAIGNQQRLDDILRLAWKVLIASGLWATAAQWPRLKAAVQKLIHVLRE